MFILPAQRASQRVTVWRKLRRYGTLPWKKSAHILPYSHANLEKFQWLATEIRKYKGEASILKVARIEGTTHKQIISMFYEARASDYELLIRDLRLALRGAASRTKPQLRRIFARLNRRMSEIAAIDAFGCSRKRDAHSLLKELEVRLRVGEPGSQGAMKKGRELEGQVWMTRPRPGVDRVSSAWLIRNFIDPEAKFIFASNPQARDGAICFNIFEGAFTHVGDDCTFETLLKRFNLRNGQLRLIAQLVHDADFGDGKFGRTEGKAIDLILTGWGKSDWSDDEILKRGFDLFDALYLTVGS
jgi:hypothetical protein